MCRGGRGNGSHTRRTHAAVPAGLVYASATGQRYYTESAYRIGTDGTAAARVKAEASGVETNLPPDEELSLVSSIPPGIDSTAVVSGEGITGGADAESDEAYLVRVLQTLRNATRYGKSGDFADWAVDSSPEVSKAWEFKNFGVFGALLIQVIGGNHIDGITPVGGLALVTEYINTVAPPVLFTVRTPALRPLNPAVALVPAEDTLTNREIVTGRLKTYLEATARPGIRYTAGMLRDALIDGVTISGGAVKLSDSTTGEVNTTILQLPVLGDLS
ncbi:MAG: baseplate J/gp47 family protein [Treponema sp.]|nr:baseplate J/gp47 family protein [Treponema sp.]